MNDLKVGDLVQTEAYGIGLLERIDKDGWYWINFFTDPFCMGGNRRGYTAAHVGQLTKVEARGEYNPQ